MNKVLSALVIDDDSQICNFIAEVLRSDDWQVSTADSAERAIEMLSEDSWGLVFCDVVLGKIDGYEVLHHFNERQPNARFVLMSGYGSAVGALDATAIGAFDYLVKPFTVDKILALSRIVRQQHQLRAEHEVSDAVLSAGGYKSDIPLIGKSPKFVDCLKMVGRVSATNLPVLITGESGTGKELVAQAIHRRGSRADKPFIAVNCGAIPYELIESELFGHARGAFTGADRERIGLWEEADGGTILLDEITETGALFQVKLLRALQQGEIRRVGSNRTLKVDVRVIAATNRDIEEEVRQGRFRQDLMYRLNAVMIHLPPLRERVEDIALLAEHFVAGVAEPNARPVTVSQPALEILKSYAWQGNVRELENVVLHAATMCEDVIYPEHLPARINQALEMPVEAMRTIAEAAGDGECLTLAEMNTQYAVQVLARTQGNKQAAARLLDIDRKTLARIISRSNVKP